MRTKVLLCAAALAASLASSMAQVYSLNVVGYVNVTLPAGQFYAVANPLDASMGGTVLNGNDMDKLFTTGITPSSTIATFNSSAFDWDTAITYSGKASAWQGNFPMPPGVGALFFNNNTVSDLVVTFVGQVQQGTAIPVSVVPPGQFMLAGAPVPIPGEPGVLNTQLGLVPFGNDSIATFNSAAFDWNTAITWSGKASSWVGSMPIAAGQAFLYFNNNTSSANTWVASFTVQ